MFKKALKLGKIRENINFHRVGMVAPQTLKNPQRERRGRGARGRCYSAWRIVCRNLKMERVVESIARLKKTHTHSTVQTRPQHSKLYSLHSKYITEKEIRRSIVSSTTFLCLPHLRLQALKSDIKVDWACNRNKQSTIRSNMFLQLTSLNIHQ